MHSHVDGPNFRRMRAEGRFEQKIAPFPCLCPVRPRSNQKLDGGLQTMLNRPLQKRIKEILAGTPVDLAAAEQINLRCTKPSLMPTRV